MVVRAMVCGAVTALKLGGFLAACSVIELEYGGILLYALPSHDNPLIL
jgi:EamA domain-containing membrane protein RarD